MVNPKKELQLLPVCDRGLNNYQYYFGGSLYYHYRTMYPTTLF